jgi:hypothetical protein
MPQVSAVNQTTDLDEYNKLVKEVLFIILQKYDYEIEASEYVRDALKIINELLHPSMPSVQKEVDDVLTEWEDENEEETVEEVEAV